MTFISKILDSLKLERKREMEDTANSIAETDDIEKNNETNEDEAELLEVYSKIDKAKQLSKIMNTTIDKREFIDSLVRLKQILNELIKYEEKYEFNPAPSKDLKYLESVENDQIELLEKRIAEKEIKSQKIIILYEDSQETIEDISGTEEYNNIQENIPLSDSNEQSIDLEHEINNVFPTEGFEDTLELSEELSGNSIVHEEEELFSYHSKRMIIGGLHIYFISVAREILEQNAINIIPLMREYNLSEDDINQIICEMKESNVIDENKNPMMSLEEFERFVDIYEPGLFKCKNCIFDKKNFTDIGEIIFEEGAESVYDILPANEILDYLNVMESLKIISYDDYENKYNILISKKEFYDICKSVPNFRKIESDAVQVIDIDNMEGHDFEYFCADILRKNGFENVEVTQGSGDHGIDILAEKHDITYAIQCKCYSSDVGNAAVQQAHTGKSIYKKDIAVVLTNRYFTAQAKEEAAVLGVKLWDRDKLNEMIGNQ